MSNLTADHIRQAKAELMRAEPRPPIGSADNPLMVYESERAFLERNGVVCHMRTIKPIPVR